RFGGKTGARLFCRYDRMARSGRADPADLERAARIRALRRTGRLLTPAGAPLSRGDSPDEFVMKTPLHMRIAGIVLAAMVSVSLSVAAPDETETKVEKRVTTVVIDDGRDGSVPGHQIMPGEDLVDDEAGGPTAFLGVETM